jgi:hypothetical protein
VDEVAGYDAVFSLEGCKLIGARRGVGLPILKVNEHERGRLRRDLGLAGAWGNRAATATGRRGRLATSPLASGETPMVMGVEEMMQHDTHDA